MWVFYYQMDGKSHLVCVRGSFPTGQSRIWEGCNTSAFLVPGTEDDED
jgi:hypothetical protein